jgi:hypothetical protein
MTLRTDILVCGSGPSFFVNPPFTLPLAIEGYEVYNHMEINTVSFLVTF